MTRHRLISSRAGRRCKPRVCSGMMVIAALTCLLIASAIVVSTVQSAIRLRRQLHAERNLRQTELLLTAGAERAAKRLSQDANFGGDAWELPADAIIGGGAGRVTTVVSRIENRQAWSVHVVAEYPLNRDFTVRRSRTFTTSNSTTLPEELR
jgi:type II secretory pathway pseudopilin PulG